MVIVAPILLKDRRAASQATGDNYRGRAHFVVRTASAGGTRSEHMMGTLLASVLSEGRIAGALQLTPNSSQWEPNAFWRRLGFSGSTLARQSVESWSVAPVPGTFGIGVLTLISREGQRIRLTVANEDLVTKLLRQWWRATEA